jgi:hypothetical protein
MRTASSARPPKWSAPQRDGEKPSCGVLRLKCGAEAAASLRQPPSPAEQYYVTSHRNQAPARR